MSEYIVKFKDEAAEDLEALDKLIAQRILSKLKWLSQNFDAIVPERLSGKLKDLYKLRVGDWRIGYTVSNAVITIHLIGHRREVYKL